MYDDNDDTLYDDDNVMYDNNDVTLYDDNLVLTASNINDLGDWCDIIHVP